MRDHYPAGLEVKYQLADNKIISHHKYSPWRGPIEWTEDGQPYLGLIYNVVIDFPGEEFIKSIILTEIGVKSSIGEASRKPWSVSEIKLYQ